jgi:radical SAM superfamily enzyme YgiQ (UPF0313 family)
LKILLLFPPRYRGLWSSREHKDGYFNEPHNPYLAASILATVRQRLPNATLTVLDAQLDDLAFDDVKARVEAITPSAIICMLNFACLDEERRYLEFSYPTIGVLQAYIDQREAVELYRLTATAITKSEIEATVAEALAEFHETGEIRQTKGLLLPRDGGIVDTGDRALPDLDSLPFPAFDLFDIDRYMVKQREHSETRYIFLFTTRGCPFKCHYCAAGTREYAKVRKRSPDRVIEEMKYFVDRGYTDFYFYDDEFAIDKARAKEICRKIIASGMSVRFACYNTTNLVDDELLQLMAAAGCKLIRFGVETGDPAIQRRMDTYLEETEIIRAFVLAHKHSIFVDAFVMVGFPGETKDSLRKTYALLKRVDPDRITTSILFPKPYSKLYRELKADGRLLVHDWTKHVNPPGLTFVHDTYGSIEELRGAERWLRGKMDRYLAFRDLVFNKTGRNLYSRLIHYVGTFSPVRRLINHLKKKGGSAYLALRRGYQGYSKFRI